MRGEAEREARVMLGLTPDGFAPKDHPLRRIKPQVDSVLARMSPLFDELYAAGGRPSIPPEHLLKSILLMAFYAVRSERQCCEQQRYDLLFKWFLDLSIEAEPFHRRAFTKNHERLLEADVAPVLFKEVVRETRRRRLLSADHFTVDSTLLEDWASHKRCQPRDEGPPQGGRHNRPPNPCSSQGQAATPNARRPWLCSNAAACPAPDTGSEGGLRLGRSSPTTRATSYGTCAAWECRRTSLSTNRAGAARSAVIRLGALATAGGTLRWLGQARNKHWFELTAAAHNLTLLTNIEAAAA